MATKTILQAIQRRRRPLRARYDLSGYALLAPGYLVYFVFVMVPVFIGLYLSLTSYQFFGSPQFIGLRNYARLLRDEVFITSLGNTAIYTIFTVVPQMVFGLLLANALNNGLRGNGVWRSLIYIPNVTSMVAVSMIWLWIYEPIGGFLNVVLRALGLSAVRWLFNPATAMPSLIAMGIWKVVGYNMVVYLAGLQTIPRSLYEVAEIDGAGPIRQFVSITIPMLKPTTFFLLVMNTIQSFRVFEQVMIMTGGGPLHTTTTIVHQIYTRAFLDFRMGYASSMAVVLLIVIAGATVLNFQLGGRRQADVE